MLSLQTKQQNTFASKLPSIDFIPYACHYDLETILTKNGSLLQVIEIKGFSAAAKNEIDLNIRALIRKSIAKNIKSNAISVYFHTIRQARNLDQSPIFKSYFSQELHNAWVQSNYWDSKYVNNLYITLITTPARLSYSPIDQIAVSFLSKRQDNLLKNVHKELSDPVSRILQDLAQYGAVKLSIVPVGKKGYCSELVRFFNKIIHLEEVDFPIKAVDISKDIIKNEITFGDTELKINKPNSAVFSSILSIKENEDLAPEVLGNFLQLPYQMVITQAMTFLDTKYALKSLQHQEYILEVSRDKNFRESSGLEEALQVKPEDRNAFCNIQTTVMISSSNLDKLRSDIPVVYKNLCDLGIPAVKEDLNLEHCFWSQLPGNFSYNDRVSISLSSKAGAFALLNNCPFGSLKSKWGDPVTILTTALDTPYFFHFHAGKSGHTIITGDDDYAKMSLINFLLSESMKFNARFLYLDAFRQSELFLRALGVEYSVFSFDAGMNKLKLNPLLLPDSPANRSFLCYWFLFLLNLYANASNYKTYVPAINKAIEVIFSLPVEKRKLSYAAEFFTDKSTMSLNAEILEGLKPWYGKGDLAHVFDNDTDFLVNHASTNFGLDVTALFDTSMRINLPVISYILHFFTEYFTGKNPSILTIRWSNRLFNSIYFEKNLSYILDDLAKRNSVCLFTATFCSKTVNWSEKVGKIYAKAMATQIFMANNAPSYSNLVKLFNFTQEEKMYLQSLSIDANQFLLKQGPYSTIMKLDLSDCEKETAILVGNARYVSEAQAILAENGDQDPSAWIPELFEKVETES